MAAADGDEPPIGSPIADPVEEPAPPAPPSAMSTATHPRPRMKDAFRDRLLNLITTPFAARSRLHAAGIPAHVDATQPHVSAASVAAHTTVAPPDSDALVAPARLEFDVRESRSIIGEGEQLTMRIAVRNVGGAAAERVTATLFFADGVEPVQAVGHTAEIHAGEVRFASMPELHPGSSVDLIVTAVGTRPGSVAYRGELACDQFADPIAREGALTVQPRRATAP
ncbi:hypothetical protein EBR56_05310 [bacterium]|nr:hypothetical protein [bacterium]